MDLLEKVKRRDMKMIRGLEYCFCGDRLRGLGVFSLEKGRFWGNFVAAFQYLRTAYKKSGERLFTKAVLRGQELGLSRKREVYIEHKK